GPAGIVPHPGPPPYPGAPMPRKRWLGLAGLLVLVPPLGYGGLWLYLRWAGERAYAAALTELDGLRPGCRPAGLLDDRAAPPDEGNSALVILAVRDRVPPGCVAREFGRPGTPPAPGGQPACDEDDARLAPVLAEARRLADLPQGRFPLEPG